MEYSTIDKLQRSIEQFQVNMKDLQKKQLQAT